MMARVFWSAVRSTRSFCVHGLLGVLALIEFVAWSSVPLLEDFTTAESPSRCTVDDGYSHSVHGYMSFFVCRYLTQSVQRGHANHGSPRKRVVLYYKSLIAAYVELDELSSSVLLGEFFSRSARNSA